MTVWERIPRFQIWTQRGESGLKSHPMSSALRRTLYSKALPVFLTDFKQENKDRQPFPRKCFCSHCDISPCGDRIENHSTPRGDESVSNSTIMLDGYPCQLSKSLIKESELEL